MSPRLGIGQVVRPRTAGSGAFDGVQLWEGLCDPLGSPPDYTPFVFGSSTTNLPGLRTLDPGGWINPSTHAYSGSLGAGTVPAGSSIILPREGIYKITFTGQAHDVDFDFVDFSAHLGCNDDIVDGYIGFNFQASSGIYPDFDWRMDPQPLTTGPHYVAFSAGDILFWGGLTTMGFPPVMSGFTWVTKYVMPL